MQIYKKANAFSIFLDDIRVFLQKNDFQHFTSITTMSVYISQSQISGYLIGKQSFIPDLLPSAAMVMPADYTLYVLQKKLGYQFHETFNPEVTIQSPLSSESYAAANNALGGNWLKKANMVGVNVRTIHSFWNVVKYAFTLPEAQSSIHLLPIWEPGVVASLYGMSSWNINPEFFSDELRWVMPHLDTVEKQLKVVINILHGLGKTVGMDVIPHTDRYSEQVLANPQHFEWLQRIGFDIPRHEDDLYKTVQELIFDFLRREIFYYTPPSVLPDSAADFFEKMPEPERLAILFGHPYDFEGRLKRREALIQLLYDNHFEPVPATMGPPYRGLKVDTQNPPVVDKKGRIWLDYTITKPEKFSRVFGPLTRFKLYENKNNNAGWDIDFSKPISPVWEYAAGHYADIQERYNFDFMRGDMAHVQMRPAGVPDEVEKYYDILKYIKLYISEKVPYFGSFAETFLAPPGEMAYGDEVAHLEASDANTTLGDLQSMVVGSPRFLAEFRRYLDILYSRQVAPCFTIMTADKDDPRFDEFYLKGNEARFFISLFLTDMPSYMGLGFELRDPHPTPAPNEHYTKLYVFRIDEGEKATHGAYQWGSNRPLFSTINKIKKYGESILKKIQYVESQWIILPDVENKIIVWTQKSSDTEPPQYLFMVNLDTNKDAFNILLTPSRSKEFFMQQIANKTLSIDFSTALSEDKSLVVNDLFIHIKELKAGESRAYKIQC